MAVVNKVKVSGFAFGTIRPNSDLIDEHVFDDTNIVLAPFNVSGDHWELLAFYPSVRHIVYVNPLGEKPTRIKAILNAWNAITKRHQTKVLRLHGRCCNQMLQVLWQPRHRG
ncbi:hypothetical protein NP493_1155g00128 [Ridgeia piscesae]|uniref:Ubiquitin-like protease family profile domain-containing protein n=1 Tax=Ridgeia piscesae TaxID=27915 RepID=A0AAD9KGQ2_RIDPI|nr:hypothetical protein NP493_1155g00128 [Ridgeia piscesae]